VLKLQLFGEIVGLSAGEVLQRQGLDIYCLFVCTNKYTYVCIYIYILNYITNAPTCFGSSAPSSGSVYIVFAKVKKYKIILHKTLDFV